MVAVELHAVSKFLNRVCLEFVEDLQPHAVYQEKFYQLAVYKVEIFRNKKRVFSAKVRPDYLHVKGVALAEAVALGVYERNARG